MTFCEKIVRIDESSFTEKIDGGGVMQNASLLGKNLQAATKLECEHCGWPLVKDGKLKCNRCKRTVQATLRQKPTFCRKCWKPRVTLAVRNQAVCPKCNKKTSMVKEVEIMKTKKTNKISKDFASGFAFVRLTEIAPVKLVGFTKACYDPEGGGQMVDIESVPDKESQTNYIWGEGPSIISQKQIIRKITAEEAFDFLRAQILIERIKDRFPQIKGFMVLKDKIIIISDHLTVAKRDETIGQLIGAYERSDIFFCAGGEISEEEIASLQEALLNYSLPSGWELVCGSSPTWKTFPLGLDLD